MSEAGLVRADMAGVVGRPYGRMISYPVSASDIRKWARAVYYPEPAPVRYTDPETAEDGGPAAPLDFNPFAWGPAVRIPDERGIETAAAYRRVGAMEHHLGVAPPDLKRALNGGVSVTYTEVRMKPGDVITSESAIAGYREKQGRLGLMLMTDVDTVWTNQDGLRLKTHRMTLIRY
ncbi:MaoC family dehydratase N-terminal domain-containing protein [Streptomyces sp. NPDC057363]|uniref:FAS1-like dehydratase domain-containing protein n=1 Tax=Streptomyces sp. NPDC057363 TaxID=3346107 RepID=UPI00362552A3